MEDVRKILVPAAIGVAAAVTTLYGVGVFTVMAATTGGSGPSAAAPPRPPPPRGSAAAEAAGRKRAGAGLPGDAAPAVRSTTSSGVGEPGGGAAVYESSKAVDEYLLFHYGKPELLMPYDFGPRDGARFPQRCAELAAKHAPAAAAGAPRWALDVGCAVGGATFELARSFEAVVGLDFSHAFIAAAKRLLAGERLPCTATEEGTLSSWFVASPPEDVDRARCWFRQGDACDLPQAGHNFGPFHAILASNLLCRLPEPRKFLESLPRLLVPGGVAVIISPYSWLEEYTAQEHWLGGVVRGGDSVASAPALAEAMEALGFQLVEQFDMPFLIREHLRKYQWGCSHATVWRLGGAAAAAAAEE